MKAVRKMRNGHLKVITNELENRNTLYNNTKNENWSIEDANSFRTNKFLESHLEQLDELTERVAERIRCLDHQTEVAFNSRQSFTYYTEAISEKGDDQRLLGHLTSLSNIIHRIHNKL